jgi:hypothetical protein
VPPGWEGRIRDDSHFRDHDAGARRPKIVDHTGDSSSSARGLRERAEDRHSNRAVTILLVYPQ